MGNLHGGCLANRENVEVDAVTILTAVGKWEPTVSLRAMEIKCLLLVKWSKGASFSVAPTTAHKTHMRLPGDVPARDFR
jgi:hypothetical protein